jgi:Bax protein
MNRYFEAKHLWNLLVWVPVALHPFSVHASKGGITQTAARSSVMSSHPIIEVPRHEEKNLPPELKEKNGGEDNRQVFVNTILPLLLMENEAIEGKRNRMLKHFASLEHGETLGAEDQNWLRDLASEYRLDGDPIADESVRRELRGRVDIVPVDLALAQAATETGWGASRGALKDRDLFGMTAIRSKRTIKTASGQVVRAPKFSSLREAVRTYTHNLNSHDAYKPLRTIRTKLRVEHKPIQGGPVADGLMKYSTRGVHYIKQIRTVINQHNLNRYINARLLPSRDQVVALDTTVAYTN